MIETEKVILISSPREVGSFLTKEAMNNLGDFIGEYREDLLQAGVIGYYKGKVVIYKSNEIKKEREEYTRNPDFS